MLRVHKLKRGDEWPYSETAAAAKSASRVNVMVWAILEKISRSDTARTIIEALRKSDHIFDIIPLRGQGGGFFLPSCDSFPEIHRQGASGCIVWYPEATFEYYTRGPRGSVQSGIRPGWTLFAARSDLVLIHELGTRSS